MKETVRGSISHENYSFGGGRIRGNVGEWHERDAILGQCSAERVGNAQVS